MNTKQRALLVVAAAFVIVLAGCGAHQSNAPLPPVAPSDTAQSPQLSLVDQLKAELENCDAEALTQVAGLIFKSRDAADGVSYLAGQWNRTDRPECLERPLVQAFVANALAQAYANGVGSGVDVASVGASLRKGVESSDWEIAHVSISGLSAIAEQSDLKIFERIARTGSGQKRKDALLELASQCSDDATKILDSLAQQPGFDEIPSIRAEAAPLRAVRCKE